MSTTFGATSTSDQVLAGLELAGKRVLVTGVSAGLGVETARALASRGAHVTGAARDLAKARRANGGTPMDYLELDLASLASVRRAAEVLRDQDKPFDLLIANAGVMACPQGATADGFETQFGTNHLGHFVFVNRVMPLVRGRVVVLSSAGHRFADVDLEDPGFERTAYDPWIAYGRSKTANILFAVELDRRHRGSGVRATAVHPGAIKTELSRHIDPSVSAKLVEQINQTNAENGLPAFQYKTIPQGAATSLWAGVTASADEVGGRYCEDCHVAQVTDGGGVMNIRGGVRPYALDAERAKALWKKSEELVGETFAAP